jgi:HD-GYP domain-containing protein (c-di-GMP phosphodiesterase class II)
MSYSECLEIDEKFMEDLNIAALLHDIGKIGVSEEILNKKGLLSEEERKKINEHPLIGAAIIQPIRDIQRILNGVKYHHERYDGCGYPEGLKQEQIPLIASIIAVADSYDAMTTNRPYRPALSRVQAIAEVGRCSGTQFHPLVVKALEALLNENQL